MSYGRRGNRLPGQTNDRGSDGGMPDRGTPQRPASGQSSGSRPEGRGRGLPGGSKGGGGIMMLLVMAAVAFFLFRGMGNGIIDREGNPEKQQQPAQQNEPRRGERQSQPRINIPGMDEQNASDEVQTRDGWSMKDADDDRQFQFSNQEEQEPESDEVEKDGWSMKDSDDGKRDQRRDQ